MCLHARHNMWSKYNNAREDFEVQISVGFELRRQCNWLWRLNVGAHNKVRFDRKIVEMKMKTGPHLDPFRISNARFK